MIEERVFNCSMMMIEAKSITKTYQHHIALNQINISIKKGSIFGLLGPNGAGKTSLIRILTQITEPDSGEVLFNGEKLQPRHIYEMGYLPEERGLYKKMLVGEQLLYFAELKGLKNKEAKQRLKYWIDRFELKEWVGKKVEELSKGMQQKVQFIATLLHNPKLIILDEPFSGFDPINAQILVDEILLLKEQGATIIFSTHRMDSVELLCDHITLINKSEKILDGEVNQIKQTFKTNQFEISYSGIPIVSDDIIKVDSTERENLQFKTIVSLNYAMTGNQLIRHLLTREIELLGFKEKLPTMEEIFIQAVQQKNKYTHA
ncbi:MAG: ATP-binding cassette domain-containing protein [Bacteroidota bacterium]|nr:ATP-binding cassette domain-containing protein [Bacteroidota bacterium]